MNYMNEISIIELASKSRQGKIVTNKNVDYVVFHPLDPIVYFRVNGTWVKCKVEAIK